MNQQESREIIEDQEFHLEDIYEGLIALDNVLKLVSNKDGIRESHLPISRGQAINVISYVAASVARDVGRLESMQDELQTEVAEQLNQYNKRLRTKMRTVDRLRFLGRK